MSREQTFVKIIFLLLVAAFLVILGKAFSVQVINKKRLIAYYNSQILRSETIYPSRGNIMDRNGSPLAINVQAYNIFVHPKALKQAQRKYRKLAKIVPQLNFRGILGKIRKRKGFTYLARGISLKKNQVLAIKKMELDGGIGIEDVPKRVYPNNELLSQTLGFVGVDNKGLSGIEYLFDEKLRGKPRIITYMKDAKGRHIKFESQKVESDAIDLYLTIDKEIQAISEKALKEAVQKHKVTKGGIGVMDASTGEILAVANYPTYDSNNVKKSRPKDRKLSFANEPIEPGSIFKAFTVASALEHKLAGPDTAYHCEYGEFKVEDHVIHEAEQRKKYEWLSVSEILRYSSNIGTTKIAFDLTFPKLKSTLEELNIGKKTGIEIPGESRGIFVAKKNVSPLRLSNISFGQGVATTGIQMLAGYAALANGGRYIRPTIIRREDKIIKGRRVFSKQTAAELTQMLVDAVEIGTGSNARIPHFKIAGKTSTAQKPAKGGGYKGYIPGFIGFPVNVMKKFVIYVYLDNPSGKEYYGNVVAAPVFKKVARYMLYKDKNFVEVPLTQYKDSNGEKRKGLGRTELSGFDTVRIKQSASRLGPKNSAPNFIGLDKRSASQLGRKLGLNVVHKGMGVVVKQDPGFGETTIKGMTVTLIYSPPKYD